MKSFDFRINLKKLTKDKQLTEIRFRNIPGEFKVAYILNANSDFITLAEIDDLGEVDGISMYYIDEISSYNTHTLYLHRLEKKIDSSIVKQAINDIEKIEDFSFTGLASAIKNTDKLVEVAYEADFMPVGKVVDSDNQALSLVEIDEEHANPIAHTLILFSSITRMTLETPYIRDIAASLKK